MPRPSKKCSAPECGDKIRSRHYFCDRHFREIPWGIRADLMDAYRKGDGQRVILNLDKARNFLAAKLEKENMTTGQSDIIDVTLEPRMVKGKAQAFFQGDYEESHGTADNKEVWIWLPLSQIDVSAKDSRGCVTVSLPEWLAKDKGLI